MLKDLTDEGDIFTDELRHLPRYISGRLVSGILQAMTLNVNLRYNKVD